MQPFLDLFNRIDSFKKALLLLVTGLIALALVLGYRLIESDEVITAWTQPPRILYVQYPCFLQQIRNKSFAVTIQFPIPPEVKPVVTRNVTAYITDHQTSLDEFERLCDSLQKMILDPQAEAWLLPLQPSLSNPAPIPNAPIPLQSPIPHQP